MEHYLGILASILAFVGMIVYIYATKIGLVESSSAGWLIWTVVSGMAMVVYLQANGLISSSFVSIGYFIGTAVTFTALAKYSNKSDWILLEKCTMCIALILCFFWFVIPTDTLMILVLVIDIVGAIPIIYGAYRNPKGEYAPAWFIGFSANLVNLFAITEWTFNGAAYPFYLTATTFTVCVLTLRKSQT